MAFVVASEERSVMEKPEDMIYPLREYSVCMARGGRSCSDRRVDRKVMFYGENLTMHVSRTVGISGFLFTGNLF